MQLEGLLDVELAIKFYQRKFSRKRHAAAPFVGGNHLGIVPITHPTHKEFHTAIGGGIPPIHPCVIIASPIHVALVVMLSNERCPVPMPYKVLCSRSTIRRATADTNQQYVFTDAFIGR